MRIPLMKVCRDYLAYRGESPDLLPELAENEWSPVLNLTDEVSVKLLKAAEQATLDTPPLRLDELRSGANTLLVGLGNYAIARMPADYLCLYRIRMNDWAEPVTKVENNESLRSQLGSNAPAWMICPHRPMVKEARDELGVYLKIYGTKQADRAAELIYVPIPAIEGEELVLSAAAYPLMLDILCRNA